jgi:hypothetical protein
MYGKVLGGGILFLLGLLYLGHWIWVIIGLIIVLFLIRFGADIFWWGRDNGKW